AVRAEQSEDLSRRDGELDPLHGLDAAGVGLAKAAHLECELPVGAHLSPFVAMWVRTPPQSSSSGTASRTIPPGITAAARSSRSAGPPRIHLAITRPPGVRAPRSSPARPRAAAARARAAAAAPRWPAARARAPR